MRGKNKKEPPPGGRNLEIRKGVFISSLSIFGITAIIGIVNNQALIQGTGILFSLILDNFGWLFQIVCMLSLIVVFVICFSKTGNIRLGGPDAKPKFSLGSWFAMSLTGGVAVGIVTWGVNFPILLYGNVGGELDGFGIKAFTPKAARFAMGRSFYEWTFMPYGFYALCGALIAFLYYNKNHKLTVSDSLRPLLGNKIIDRSWVVTIVDMLSMLAIGFGITSGLAVLLSTVADGLSLYGVNTNLMYYVIGGMIVTALFTVSSYVGMDKGLKVVGNANAYLYYGLLIFLFITGPTLYILRNSLGGLAIWLDNFWVWGLDPIDIGGGPLTKSWTIFNMCMWIAYAPIMGVLLAILSHGRTIREFMIVNWILPAVFGMVWFGIWGNTAIDMQISGQLDLVKICAEKGSLAALWSFLQELPFGNVMVLINIVVIVMSFVTAADATLTNMSSLCVKDVPIGTEPPARVKVVWGIVIGAMAVVMAAFGRGAQGLDGVKSLATIGGAITLLIFALMVISAIKVFFGKQTEDVYSILEEEE
ncbi:MAG: BCCT transporter [Lachnospiraceae bacterium]|nr:BCCT transporter [Lachnospiraceae bacterium]